MDSPAEPAHLPLLPEHDPQRLRQSHTATSAPGGEQRQSWQHRRKRWDVGIVVLGMFALCWASIAILKDWSTYATFDHGGTEHHDMLQGSHPHDGAHLEEGEPLASPEKNEPSSPDYILDPKWDFTSPSQVREWTWTITDEQRNPDGVYRPMMVINGQFPGPLIEVNEHDTIRVTVINQAVNATSFHWHGLYQRGSPWMDGTVGISNCPISPGSNFTYEFKVEGQSGTYWYHSHQGVQLADGLFGPLVIHTPEERDLREAGYASDRVVMVSDHYHDTSSTLLMDYLASDRENVEPVPDSALINGHTIRDCGTVAPHRNCSNTTSNVGLPHFDLEAGKSHRLRIINTGAFAEFLVSLDEQDFALTEVDGTDVLPVRFHRFSILPAQRYSIVIDAPASPKAIWLRAKMLETCFAEPNPYMVPEVKAIINFAPSALDTTPALQVPQSVGWDEQVDLICRDMNTSALVPAHSVPAPAEADYRLYLRANFEIGAWRLSRGFFNASTFRANVQQPVLLRAIDGMVSDNQSFTPYHATGANPGAFINDAAFHEQTELVLQTNGIQVIDLVISNFDDGNHPIHLHSYKFFVLAQGHGYPPENLTAPGVLDLSNPLRRDTATVEGYGWILLRLVADNPGAWALHCHVSWHSEAGMLMTLLTRSAELGSLEVPKSVRDACAAPKESLELGMTPSDESFMHD